MVFDVVTQRDPVLRRKALATLTLARAVTSAPSVAEGFEQNWKQVYHLAECICDAHVHLRPRGVGRVRDPLRAHAVARGKLCACVLRECKVLSSASDACLFLLYIPLCM